MIEAESLAFLTWEFTDPSVHDTLVLPALLERVSGTIAEVYADAGYLSSSNCLAIAARNAVPFIKPKSNTRGRPAPGARDRPAHRTSEPFRDMVDAYRRDVVGWLAIYGRRNRIESAFGGLKRRFGGAVAATGHRMRRVEAAMKVVVWNLTRVTQPYL
jgi:hypothetical protein